MSSFESRFTTLTATFLQDNFIAPVAKFITENIESLKEKSVEEITQSLREYLDLPQAEKQVSRAVSSQGVSSMAPSLVSAGMPTLAGLGAIAPVAVKETKKRATKKEVPPQVWISVDEYKTMMEGGAKICAYYSKSKDESKNNKVCGAKVEDEDATNPNPCRWRCVSCKDKKTDVEPYIKKPVNGLDPMKNSPLPGLPQIPLASSLPPLATMMGSLPPLPETVAIPAKSPKKSLDLAVNAKLKKGHYVANNSDLQNIIFEASRVNGEAKAMAIGKFDVSGDVSEDYASHLLQLTEEEQKSVKSYMIEYAYKTPENQESKEPTESKTLKPASPVVEAVVKPASPVKPSASALPPLPGLPGLPSLPGLPGLPSIPNIPGLMGK